MFVALDALHFILVTFPQELASKKAAFGFHSHPKSSLSSSVD